MKTNYQEKDIKKDMASNNAYAYYSRVLNKPFDSVTELKNAEAKHFAELKAKEDKVAAKKADALRVEVAFKELNQARKDYKENLLKLTNSYQEDLRKLKTAFEADKNRVHAALADAETKYSTSLKEFTSKYPEGYHITLKDGDFETTISSQSNSAKTTDDINKVFDIFSYLFGL